MADLELLALRQKLEEVQVLDSVHKLSERNVIEIVNKCKELGLLKVLYTTTGKEYITPKQLEIEIQDEVLIRGGRVNMVDLQPALLVDLSYIEEKVAEILKKDSSMQLVKGELVATYYLDTIAEEVEEMLQEAGQLSLSDLAKRFDLPRDYIETVMVNRLGSIIQGTFENGSFSTDAYVQRQEAQIRGIFSAITNPTPLHQLQATYRLDSSMFHNILDDLFVSGKVEGGLSGRQDRASFVPNVYTRTQAQYVETFFNQNNYIEYTTLERLQISNPRAFMKKRFPKAIALDNFVLKREFLDHVYGTVEETARSEGFLDVLPLLPPPATTDDCFLLLKDCPVLSSKGKSLGASLIGEQYVISKGFLDRCLESVKQLVSTKAESGAFASKESTVKDSGKSAGKDDGWSSDEDDRGKKGKRGGKKKAAKHEEPEEEEDTSNKKKGKGGKADKKGKKGDKGQTADKAAKEPKQESKMWISEAEIITCLTKDIDDMTKRFGQHVVQKIGGSVQHMCEEAARQIFMGGNTKFRKQQTQFEERANALYSDMMMYEKAMADFKDPTGTLEKHFLKTVCADFVHLLIEHQSMLAGKDAGAMETVALRQKALERIHGAPGKSLKELSQLLSGDTVSSFVGKLSGACETCDIHLKAVDKKKERSAMFNRRHQIGDQLKDETDPVVCFHLALTLLHGTLTGQILHFPGKFAPTVLDLHLPTMPEEAQVTLKTYREKLLVLLTKQASTEEDVVDNVLRLKTELGEMLPALKTLVASKENLTKKISPKTDE